MAESILDVLWADAQLLGVSASYDTFELELCETTGRRLRVIADGHIGFELVGLWDETVIETADLVPRHPFVDRCMASIVDRFGESLPATGSPARNAQDFSTLVVTLSDGARLYCAAGAFRAAASTDA